MDDLTQDQQIDALLTNSDDAANAVNDADTESHVEETDEEKAAVAAAEALATQQTDFNPEDWSLNVKGQVLNPKDREHLVNLAQQGMSYSDSMAKLNEEKQRMAEEYEPLKQYAALDQQFRDDPAFQNHLTEAINTYRANKELGTEETPPYVQQLLQRVETMEQHKSQQDQTNADGQLATELNALKAEYPTVDWDADEGEGTFTHQVLKHAYENGIPSLKSAFRDIMFDQVALNAKAEALKAAEKKKLDAIKAGKVTAGTNGARVNPNADGYASGDSYNDAAAKALRMIS